LTESSLAAGLTLSSAKLKLFGPYNKSAIVFFSQIGNQYFMRYILLFLAYVFIAFSINCNSKEQSNQSNKDSVETPTSSPVQSNVREEIIDALIEQVLNDPLVHLKYWHWGGHSTNDLDKYILKKYEDTQWKVTPEEAKALKSQALETLDIIYSRKAKKKFNP
jgi:hypothetical protein